jgi:hypothetical protein
MNRRNFLRGGFLGAGDAPKVPAGGGNPATAPRRDPEDRVAIGRLGDFPVGEVRRLEPLGLEIESLPEGLRARALGSPRVYCAITAGASGELMAGRQEPWPPEWVFSALINGPTGLDIGMEEGG